MDFFSLVILFLLISSTLQPLLQARYLAMQRARQIATIEKERNVDTTVEGGNSWSQPARMSGRHLDSILPVSAVLLERE
jgi:hypothetical protein